MTASLHIMILILYSRLFEVFQVLQHLKKIFRKILPHCFRSYVVNEQGRIISTRLKKSFQVSDILSQPFFLHEENGTEFVINVITHCLKLLVQAYERRYSLTTIVEESQSTRNQSVRSSIAYSKRVA